ncbi:MAG: three-Cys-motif partner protein TcmP [Actinomycetota bacterium]|nr:three-Cys-motif partner protein TcmP [Actinomycetota bacterium]
MSASEEFFAQQRTAAAFKHGILKRYPVVFAGKAGSITSGRVVFLDGYAGPGRYDDGSPGSPLLFVQAARRLGKLRKVTAIFVEQHPDRCARLREVLTEVGATWVNYQTLEGDLGAHLPGLLPATSGAALFAFLDPFGTALDREQLRSQLLGRAGRAPTEILLHVSVSTVARIGGLLRQGDVQSLFPSSAAVGGSLELLSWWRCAVGGGVVDGPAAPGCRLRRVIMALRSAWGWHRTAGDVV